MIKVEGDTVTLEGSAVELLAEATMALIDLRRNIAELIDGEFADGQMFKLFNTMMKFKGASSNDT